jgi:uncharacterized RmlC-like cupin family protein
MANIIRSKDTLGNEVCPNFKVDSGINSKTVVNPRMAMAHVTLSPGERNQFHYHVKCDAGNYILKGNLRYSFGPEFQRKVFDVGPGDFIYVPRGEIHSAMNLSNTEPAELISCYNEVGSREEAQTIFVEPPIS